MQAITSSSNLDSKPKYRVLVVCPINFAGFKILRVSASLCKSVSHNPSELMTQTTRVPLET